MEPMYDLSNALGEAEIIWDANCATGESPVWDDARGVVWFCDSPAGRVLGYDVTSGRRLRFGLGEVIGSLALCEDGRLLLARRAHLDLFDPKSGRIEGFCQFEDVPDGHRLNDGKCGPDGAFWVGTADLRQDKQPTGRLFRVTAQGTLSCVRDGLVASNGLAWAPDAKTMFHSDSRGPWIDRYDFDVTTGTATNRQRMATLSVEDGRPDGAACDVVGRYWSAGVSAECLNVFGPDGTPHSKLPVPVPCPTMPCFAPGALFVTSLWGGAEKSKHPNAGALVRIPTGLAGTPIQKFPI